MKKGTQFLILSLFIIFSISFVLSADEKIHCEYDKPCTLEVFGVADVDGNEVVALIGKWQKPNDLWEPYVTFTINGEYFYQSQLREGTIIPWVQGSIEGKMINVKDIVWNEEGGSYTTFILEKYRCLGCEYGGKCYLSGEVYDEMFCSYDNITLPRKENRNTCENDFECISDICIKSKCKSDSKIAIFFRKIFSIF